MAGSNVPKFGNWESQGEVPFTVYFDKARKNIGAKMTNPNDLQGNPDMNYNVAPSRVASASGFRRLPTKPEESNIRGPIRPTPELNVHREDIHYRQFSNPPARNVNLVRSTQSELNYGQHGQRQVRSERLPGAGYDQSFERSPLNSQDQVKEIRVAHSPAWEEMSYGSAHATPSRPRQRTVLPRRNESPDRGATVPRFGDWNENDPKAAENFTGVFNRVREERNTPPAHVSNTPTHSSHSPRIQPSNKPKQKCCFLW